MAIRFYSKGSILALTGLLLLTYYSNAGSQDLSDKVDMSFGIKAWDPVHIKVDEREVSSGSKPIRFTAQNSTYYPFILKIDFIQFLNLGPTPPNREIEVSHGINNLFTFSVLSPSGGYGYRYTVSYWLPPSEDVIDAEFPYLIPIKEGHMVNSKKTSSGRINDTFSGTKGDTVFCMRRGLVTAVPHVKTLDFRLSENNCLEVLHEDGTYLIYHYLKNKNDFITPGKIVLPGQPIGELSDSSYLLVTLMKLGHTKNLLISQPIRYAISKAGTLSFVEIDGLEKCVYPPEVIRKEMNPKELKNLNKKR